jgi:hypothetical protein
LMVTCCCRDSSQPKISAAPSISCMQQKMCIRQFLREAACYCK